MIVKEKNISSVEWSLFIIFPFIALLFSKAVFIQLQSVTVFLACCFVIVSNNTEKTTRFGRFILFLCVYGSAIGLYHVVDHYNDLFKYLQYSFLAFSAYIGFKTGSIYVSKHNLITIIIFLFLVDTLMFVSLRGAGHIGRTSIGTSNLLPVMLFLLLTIKKIDNYNQKLIIYVSVFVSIIAYLTSGMRSSIGVMTLSIIALIIYSLSWKLVSGLLRLIIILVILSFIISIFIPKSFINNIETRVDSVVYRFETTIFNDEGIKLDSNNNEGREEEAQSAIDEFFSNSGFHEVLGYGHGFIYFDRMQQRVKAHLHITYVAYYVRYGIVGILFLVTLYSSVLFFMFRSFFKSKTFENGIRFSLWLSVFQICLISLFAASLISTVHWIIIGFAFAYEIKVQKQLKTTFYLNESKNTY